MINPCDIEIALFQYTKSRDRSSELIETKKASLIIMASDFICTRKSDMILNV